MNRMMPPATINRFRMMSPIYRNPLEGNARRTRSITQAVMKWSLNVRAKSASLSNRDDIGLKGYGRMHSQEKEHTMNTPSPSTPSSHYAELLGLDARSAADLQSDCPFSCSKWAPHLLIFNSSTLL